LFDESALSLTPTCAAPARHGADPRSCGEKATLLRDGLPSHRSTAMRDWIRTQQSWLVVERLPAYAPESNPVEGLWSSLKAVELANLCGPTLAEVIAQV
jgi:transposase